MDQQLILYILKLSDERFYVGTTKNLDNRLRQHKNGEGAEWTKKYKYIDLISSREVKNQFEEDQEVKILMSLHGIDNVRGGSYSNIILEEHQYKCLKNELNHAQGKCLKCGSDNHYIKDCTKFEHVSSGIEKLFCTRCGRNSHTKQNCYASTLNFIGIPISDINYCHKCGRIDHCDGDYSGDGKLSICKYKRNRNEKKQPNDYCMRCGNNNHAIVDCYAKNTYDGKKL